MLKQILKNTVQGIANRAGVKISRLPNNYAFGADAFGDVGRILKKSDPTVFDVGSNVGQTVARITSLFPAAGIHCFEPSPEVFGVLSDKLQHEPNIWLNNIGMADTAGSLELIENSSADMTSFLEPGDVWGQVVRRTKVEVSTVDAYCAANRIDYIDLLKIDTQGYDYQVLRGSSEMLSRRNIRFALCEISLDDMYVGTERFDKLFAYMYERGYALFGIYDQHWRHEKLSWADAMFVPQ